MMTMRTRTKMNRNWVLLVLLTGFFAIATSKARAQDAPPMPDDGDNNGPGGILNNGPENRTDSTQDPPSRVARISYLDGSVSFQPGGQGDWGAATRNRPVTIGDKIWADADSRAELQAGQASIHIASMTALSFLNLDEQTTQMRLAEGTINFRVRELREGDIYEIDTPNLAFTVTQAGAFRVNVNENGDGTRITAIRGEGQVTTNGQTYTIHSGERGEFNGTDNVTYFVSPAPAADDFDRWANQRDLREDNSVSARYVSRDVPGYSDLDDHGSWNEEPDYGPVWYPSAVDAGWAPYSYGSWNYVGPWGWSWVGYEPWGFAPYHYGRWAYIGSRWGWCPGPYYAHPVYGPAFVGFLGGSHWGVGFGFGGAVGWFPLGPREPFHPWYRTSHAYYRNVNARNTVFRNTTVINNRTTNFNYAYAHNARAVTVASHNNFVNGERISRGAYHVTDASLRGAEVTNRANFTPNRQSYVGAAGMHGNIARPSAAIQNRPVMARTAPAAAASHMPVRGFNSANNGQGRGGFGTNNSVGSRPLTMGGRTAQTGAAAMNNRPAYQQGAQSNPHMSSRQRELSSDKPQSHLRNVPSDSAVNGGTRGPANSGNTRNWSAQGNTTDRGRAPEGFGSNSPRNSALTRSDRPPTARVPGNRNSNYSVNPRSSSSGNRPEDSSGNHGRGNGRTYEPPQRNSGSSLPSYNSNRGGAQPRSYNPQQRTYSAPAYSQPRGNSAPRSYSAPSAPTRSYSPPSRGSSAPSHTSGGGGSSHGGGGGSRGSSGGSPHGRR